MALIGPVRFQGKYGFINAKGEWVIAPTFEELGEMREGLASFAVADKLGFINEHSEVVIEPRFNIPRGGCWVCGFSEGLASVQLAKRMGYINPLGEFVIRLEPDALGWDFVQSRAIVSSSTTGFTVIDKTGQRLVKLEVHDILYFSQWPQNWDCFVCLFFRKDNYFAGAINWRGEIVFPPKYAGLGDFFDGVAMFAVEEDHRYFGPQGLVRIDEKVVVEPCFRTIGEFSEGLAPACKAKKSCGFINTQGEFVIPPVYEQALSFQEGLACVTVKGKKGFINPHGDIVIEPRFRRQGSFRDGVAWVECDGKAGYVDRTGRMIWERPLELDPQSKLWL